MQLVSVHRSRLQAGSLYFDNIDRVVKNIGGEVMRCEEKYVSCCQSVLRRDLLLDEHPSLSGLTLRRHRAGDRSGTGLVDRIGI